MGRFKKSHPKLEILLAAVHKQLLGLKFGGSIAKFKIYEPGSGYTVAPTVTVYDPEETGEPYYTVHIRNGVLPTIIYNRGAGYSKQR